jgi:hypothetical protein
VICEQRNTAIISAEDYGKDIAQVAQVEHIRKVSKHATVTTMNKLINEKRRTLDKETCKVHERLQKVRVVARSWLRAGGR